MDNTKEQEVSAMSQQQKKKVAGLEALKNISIPEMEPPKPKRKAQQKPTTTKGKKVIFSLHLPAEAHEQLRELSFHEHISMTKLLLEGVDELFQKRGLASLDESKTQ